MTRRVMLRAADDRIRVIEESELTVTQVKALLLLVERGRISGGTIAEQLGLSPAAASRALDSMVQRGVVTRTECENDRRIRLFEATPKGIEIATGLADLRRSQIEHYLEGFDAEALANLIDALAPFELEAPEGE